MKSIKKFVVVFILLAIFVPGSIALANTQMTQSEIQAKISELMKLIEELRKQIPQEKVCMTFNRDLAIGSAGEDVTRLQKFLVSKGFLAVPAGVDYGYFGSLTQSGVAKWQSANGITEIKYGYFGANSRQSFGVCDDIVEVGSMPVITSISGPTSLGSSGISRNLSEKGTWTINAYSPSGSPLTYSVYWGQYEQAAGSSHEFKSVDTPQATTFTHQYFSEVAGLGDRGWIIEYKPRFVVRDTQGRETVATISVRVNFNPENTSVIKMISPDGGVFGADGAPPIRIKWTEGNPGITEIALIYAGKYDGEPSDYNLNEKVVLKTYSSTNPNKNGAYNFYAPDNIFDGVWYIQITEAGTGNVIKSQKTISISSRG
jgi:peptidoglycan hydrolase-like protein with peptidoglycan-binding domain